MPAIINRIRKAASRSISTKYSLVFALLVNVTVTVILVSAGLITFSQFEAIRYQVQDAVAKAQALNEERELRRTGSYLSHRLREPLGQQDMRKLNAQIEEVATWLPISSFLIMDPQGRILTDGTSQNPKRLQKEALPDNLRQKRTVSTVGHDGRELAFAVGEPGNTLGYAKLTLEGLNTSSSLEALDLRLSQLWNSYAAFLIGIGAIALALVLCLAVILVFFLSRSLVKPLHEMIQAAREYAMGNLETQLAVRSDDELGQLAQSLNIMAADLRKTGGLLTSAQEIANLGSWEWDAETRELSWSRQALRILGYRSARGKPDLRDLLRRVVPSDRRQLTEVFRRAGLHPMAVDFVFRRLDGTLRTLRLQGKALHDATNKRPCWTGTLQDVTERKAAEETLNYMANYDALTGLPNRNRFQRRLQDAIANAEVRDTRFALLFLDLDSFKGINDALGHAVGDEVLKIAANRLRQTIRESDTVARLGGDEFTVILENIGDHRDVALIAERIADTFSHAFVVGDRDLGTSCSVGITMYPDDGTEMTDLLKNADIAMYRSKSEGRGLYRFFTPEMNREAQDRLALENQLRTAVKNREFELHYQPQLSLETGEVMGVEALVRWRTEVGLVPPAKFVPALEQSGMIEELTPWAFLTACRQVRAWRDLGFPDFRMALNLSARQLLQTNLLAVIDAVLRETGIAARNIEIEVTESVLLDPEAINATARELLAMGIHLTIDDFGTGYCSLSYLKQLSADALKIDRSFIQDIPADQDDVAISSAIINLSRSLGLVVVAEGVETPEQWEFLQRQGCNLMQGFLASKALSADDFTKWLRTSCRQIGGRFYWNFCPTPSREAKPPMALVSGG